MTQNSTKPDGWTDIDWMYFLFENDEGLYGPGLFATARVSYIDDEKGEVLKEFVAVTFRNSYVEDVYLILPDRIVTLMGKKIYSFEEMERYTQTFHKNPLAKKGDVRCPA